MEPEVKFVEGDVFLFKVKVLPALRNVLAPLPFLGWISNDILLFRLSIQLVGLFGPGLLRRECILAKVESNSKFIRLVSIRHGWGTLTTTALLMGRLQQCGKLIETVVSRLMDDL